MKTSSFSIIFYLVALAVAQDLSSSSSTWNDIRNDIIYLVKRGVGPTCIKLTGHGTLGYNKEVKIGGLQEFLKSHSESEFGSNNGTKLLLSSLEKIKLKYPSISRADLYSFCSAIVISNSCGPEILWRPGRSDAIITNESQNRENSGNNRIISVGNPRISNRTNTSTIREAFANLGLGDKCTVALAGTHGMGRSHPENSGYANLPRTFNELRFSNAFFVTLASTKWYPGNFTYKNNKQTQFFNKNHTLAVLDSDMNIAPINASNAPTGAHIDPIFREIAKSYALNNTLFLQDFKYCFESLLELGFSLTQSAVSTRALNGNYTNLCEKLDSSVALVTEESGTLNEGTIEILSESLDNSTGLASKSFRKAPNFYAVFAFLAGMLLL